MMCIQLHTQWRFCIALNCFVILYWWWWPGRGPSAPVEGSVHASKSSRTSHFPVGQKQKQAQTLLQFQTHKRGNLKVNKWARWDGLHSQIHSVKPFPMEPAHNFNRGLRIILRCLIYLVMKPWSHNSTQILMSLFFWKGDELRSKCN